MEIQIGHKSYSCDRYNGEPDRVLSERIWFIINQEPSNDAELRRAIEKEHIWYNKCVLGCRYHPRVELAIPPEFNNTS